MPLTGCGEHTHVPACFSFFLFKLSPFPDASHFRELNFFTASENVLFLIDCKWSHHLLGIDSKYSLSVPYCGSLTANDLILCPPFPAPVSNVLKCLSPIFLIINPARKSCAVTWIGQMMRDMDLQAGAVVVTLE